MWDRADHICVKLFTLNMQARGAEYILRWWHPPSGNLSIDEICNFKKSSCCRIIAKQVICWFRCFQNCLSFIGMKKYKTMFNLQQWTKAERFMVFLCKVIILFTVERPKHTGE